MTKHRWLLLLAVFTIVFQLQAQKYNFHEYSLEQGLPQSEVTDIISDSRGFLWVGTNGGGLSRFNGKEFITLNTQHGLVNDQILSLDEDALGRIFAFTSRGFSIYEGQKFKNFSHDNGFTSGNRFSLCRSTENDSISLILSYISPNEVLAYILNDNTISPFDYKKFLPENCLPRTVRMLDGTYYLATSCGLYTFSGEKLVKSSLGHETGYSFLLPIGRVDEALYFLVQDPITNNYQVGYVEKGKFALLNHLPKDIRIFSEYRIDAQKNIWIVNSKGVLRFNKTSFTQFTQDNGLSLDLVSAIEKDHEDNMWVGTRGRGLMRFGDERFINFNKQNGLSADLVRSIYQDEIGNLWFGCLGGGLTKYDGKKFTHFFNDSKDQYYLAGNFVTLANGTFYYCSNLGVYYYNGASFQKVNAKLGIPDINTLLHISKFKDTLLVSYYNVGLFIKNKKTSRWFTMEEDKIISNRINSVDTDSKGRIWICTDLGITCIVNDTIINYDEKNGMLGKNIMQMSEDSYGTIWFASFGGGLLRFENNRFSTLHAGNGLTSNSVYSVIADSSNNIWAGSQSGIERIVLNDEGNIETIRFYGKAEGFIGGETNGQAVSIDHQGRIWFGTINGATCYDLRFDKAVSNKPIAFIRDIKLYMKTIDWNKEPVANWHDGTSTFFSLPTNLRLPNFVNNISFEYESASFSYPDGIRYSWFLEGFDENWSPMAPHNSATYTNLPAGHYVFKLKVCNEWGTCSENIVSYEFSILSPFYTRWWFFVLLAAILLVLGYIFFRMRISHIKGRKEELERLVVHKTVEVHEQNIAILAQNKVLEKQKSEIANQAEVLKDAYSNLALLSEIGKDITNSLNVRTIAEKVYENVNTLMDASIFGIGLYDPDTESLVFSGIKEFRQELQTISVSTKEENRLAIICFNRQEEIFIGNFQEEYLKYIKDPILTIKGSNSISIIYQPLSLGEKRLGVLTVQTNSPNAYNQYHLNITRNISIYTAIALENAKAYHELSIKSKHLEDANSNIVQNQLKIELQNKELMALNEEKSKLIGIVAHDLRNPITASLTSIDIIKIAEPYLSKVAANSLKSIHEALWRMHQMIEKILDIKAIEQKSLNLHTECVNLLPILQEIKNNFQRVAQNKNIDLILQVAEKDAAVYVDKNYTIQIFENLISNAIKFSPHNRNVYIRYLKQGSSLRTEVEDEGPGFTEEEIGKLFKIFQQFSAQPTADEKSTGIGLSIVKKYVDAMDGKVWCESAYGKGSKFIVEFEIAEAFSDELSEIGN